MPIFRRTLRLERAMESATVNPWQQRLHERSIGLTRIYYKLDDERRYEVISGELLVAPALDTWHQNWINNLTLLITPFVRLKKLGTVFVAPLDVVLNEENVVQPDLVFVSGSNSGIIEKRGVFGTPDLLVEMISPSSVRRDRYQKKELYARFGVKEYWIGDPANKSMEVLTLKGSASSCTEAPKRRAK